MAFKKFYSILNLLLISPRDSHRSVATYQYCFPHVSTGKLLEVSFALQDLFYSCSVWLLFRQVLGFDHSLGYIPFFIEVMSFFLIYLAVAYPVVASLKSVFLRGTLVAQSDKPQTLISTRVLISGSWVLAPHGAPHWV